MTKEEASEQKVDVESKADAGSIELKKEIGILDAVAIIVGIIVGGGIFISPGGVMEESGSVGGAMVVWASSGTLCLVGAICYAELGTMIPKSGGDYAYLNYIFGSLPSFLYLWVALFVIMPIGNAIMARTFAKSILQPLDLCNESGVVVPVLAAIVTCMLTAINCYNVKWVTKVQNLLTATKVFALVVIIIAGFYWLVSGHTENFKEPFAKTKLDPGSIAFSMYSGLYSYAGWNCLNFVTEELQNPSKNLPKAISISLPLITVIYVLTNVAYFAVIKPEDMIKPETVVAVVFSDQILGWWSWTMPFFVACSTFGALNGGIFSSARLFYAGARDGKLPAFMALINVKNSTPVPSLIVLCLITLCFIFVENIYSLIYLSSFVEILFITTSVLGLLWLRYKKPDLDRPIKVFIFLPILFFVVGVFLLVCSCIKSVQESNWGILIGIGIISFGIPVHHVFISQENKPQLFIQISDKLNTFFAKLFMCAVSDRQTDDHAK